MKAALVMIHSLFLATATGALASPINEWRGNPIRLKIRISNRLHPAPRGAQMGWNRVLPEVMRSFFADFRAWPRLQGLAQIGSGVCRLLSCSTGAVEESASGLEATSDRVYGGHGWK
jgi:hypothetical protein